MRARRSRLLWQIAFGFPIVQVQSSFLSMSSTEWPPAFQAHERATDLLIGPQLYSSDETEVRELLQNAADACALQGAVGNARGGTGCGTRPSKQIRSTIALLEGLRAPIARRPSSGWSRELETQQAVPCADRAAPRNGHTHASRAPRR